MGRHSRLSLIVCALVAAGNASAATQTGTLAVSATVASNCLLTIATMAFGIYTPGAGNVTRMGQIRVLCTDGMPYEIGLGAGLAPGGTEANRSMQNGAALLSYQMFKDPSRTENWGQALAVDRDTGTGNGMSNDNLHRIYGRIPDSAGNQLAAGGSYTDTVLVTITY